MSKMKCIETLELENALNVERRLNRWGTASACCVMSSSYSCRILYKCSTDIGGGTGTRIVVGYSPCKVRHWMSSAFWDLMKWKCTITAMEMAAASYN